MNVLRAFAARAASEGIPADVTAPLAGMLRSWPVPAEGHPNAEVQSLNVDSRRIALTVSIDGDPGEFLATIRPPPGFVLEQPGIAANSERRARLALTFTRQNTPATGASSGDHTP